MIVSTSKQPTGNSLKLGEELPVFYEHCGYSLHGLPQTRCEHCTILQFHCPECGHHQPINTLRPAAQTILGRIRGGWLGLVILFKLNLFAWLLFAWAALGAELSYTYDHDATDSIRAQALPNTPFNAVYVPARFNWENTLAIGLFAWPLGMIWRMALLCWKRGWAVGLVLAGLIILAMMLGVEIRRLDLQRRYFGPRYTGEFAGLMALAYLAMVVGAATVWPIWTLLVHAFLPKRTATVLLNWQCSLSQEVSALARP